MSRNRMATLVACALLGLLPACSGSQDAATTTTSTSTSTSTTTTTTTTTAPPARVDTTAALLRPADAGEGWRIAERSVAAVQPELGFCGEFVSVRAVDVVRSRALVDDAGQIVGTGIVTFTGPDDAAAYLAAVADTVSCDSWVDAAGLTNRVALADRAAVVADEAIGFTQTVQVGDTPLAVDISYLRRGRAVAFVTYSHVPAPPPADGLPPIPFIDRLAAVAANRLGDAVAT